MPPQQLYIVFISKQTFQAWYYRSIPHNLGRDFLPARTFFTLKLRGTSRLILYRDALHTEHASKFSYSSPRHRMQSLGHACIFWISNPKEQTTCFASYVVVGNSFALGSIFFMIFNNCPNDLSDAPFFALH